MNSVPLIGIVATNQFRKDFGCMASVCAGLLEHFKGAVRFWWHVDRDVLYWSIPALIADYALGEHVEITHPVMTDQEMASRYRACSVTLHPGLGEGFGYPIFESLACGVPAVHGDYAGGASILSTCGLDDLLVRPRTYRLEGQFNSLRPVYDPRDWVERVVELLARDQAVATKRSTWSVQHLAWDKLKHPWKKWFREGLGTAHEDK